MSGSITPPRGASALRGGVFRWFHPNQFAGRNRAPTSLGGKIGTGAKPLEVVRGQIVRFAEVAPDYALRLVQSVGSQSQPLLRAADPPALSCSVVSLRGGRSLRGWRTTSLVACWFTASVGVWAWTVAYGTTTAQPARSAFANPAPIVGRPSLVSEQPTLYLFMHPRCPCTRATIAQLQRVLTAAGLNKADLPGVVVVATIPSGPSANHIAENDIAENGTAESDDAWRQSDTLRLASALPNATVFFDKGGVQARNFGAQASGSVALYAADGGLLFSGGVTVSRGHEGDCLGSEQLLQQIQNPNKSVHVTAPALGCRLCLED